MRKLSPIILLLKHEIIASSRTKILTRLVAECGCMDNKYLSMRKDYLLCLYYFLDFGLDCKVDNHAYRVTDSMWSFSGIAPNLKVFFSVQGIILWASNYQDSMSFFEHFNYFVFNWICKNNSKNDSLIPRIYIDSIFTQINPYQIIWLHNNIMW